jgi:Polysaccharide biosynthesis/export protein
MDGAMMKLNFSLVATACFGVSLTLTAGCAALRPVDGVPARYVPDALKAEGRSGKRTINLSLLGQTPPPAYQVDTGDVLAVYIENFLGRPDQAPPVQLPQQLQTNNEAVPSLGFPLPVREDGTIALPVVGNLPVRGLTLQQAENAVRRAVTVDRQLVKPHLTISVTLQRPRMTRVLVFRQEGAIAGPQTLAAGQLNLGNLKRGTGKVVQLSAYHNDVLTALSETGGMPGTDVENTVYIVRARTAYLRNRGQHHAALGSRSQHTHGKLASASEKPIIRAQSPSNNYRTSAASGNPPTNPYGGRYQSAGWGFSQPNSIGTPAGPVTSRYPSSGFAGAAQAEPQDYYDSSADQYSPQTIEYGYDQPESYAQQASDYAEFPTPSNIAQATYGHDYRQEASNYQQSQALDASPSGPVVQTSNQTPGYGQFVPVQPGSSSPIGQMGQQPAMTPGFSAAAPTPYAASAYAPGPQAQVQPNYNGGPTAALPPATPQWNPWQQQLGGQLTQAPPFETFDDVDTIDSPRIIRIPLRLAPGEQIEFLPEDVLLYDGDVIYIESRDTEVFYTGGLLGGGQFTLPRDMDINVMEAISLAQGVGRGQAVSRALASTGGSSALNGDVSISASEVIILRPLPDGTQIPIKVDLYKAVRDPAERIIIQPGDYILLQYTRLEAFGAFIERHLLEGALFGVAAAQLNNTGN